MVNTKPISASTVRQLFDESYRQQENQLHQFVLIDKSFIATAQFNASDKKYVGFQRYDILERENWFSAADEIRRYLSNLPSGSGQSPINIGLSDQLYTLVPKALFEDHQLNSYLALNHPAEEMEQYTVQHNLVENLQLAIVYGIPSTIKEIVEDKLPMANWSHFSKALLENASLNHQKEKFFQLHIQANRFDVLLMNQGKLQFFNSFSYESAEDFIYYLLYVMEQLELDREEQEVDLVGEFEENSALYEMLYKYIRNINVGKRSRDVNFSNSLSALPPQYYFNLFNQHLCG